MSNKQQKSTIILIIFIVNLLFSALLPKPAHARNFFQTIGHGIRKTVNLVVKLPDKATRWMGPVLGPIASNMLSANLAQSSKIGKIFVKAHRAQNIINDIDEQKQLVNELKSAYQEQSQELSNIASQIRQQRKDLAAELVKGNLEYDDYINRAVALEKLAESYDAVAVEFSDKSHEINEGTIIKIVTNNALNTLASKIKNSVIFEIKTEISKFIRQDVINRLLGDKLTNSDLLIDMLVDDDLGDFLKSRSGGDFDIDELRNRLRDRIKELARESRDDLRQNWQENIRQAIEELAAQMEQDKSNLSPPSQSPASPSPANEINNPSSATDSRCKPGYEWDHKVGKCKQTNCNSIENAHWSYVVDCVCGSSGSINEKSTDPNKECTYTGNYQSCPGCVYACVNLDEDCPLEGIAGY